VLEAVPLAIVALDSERRVRVWSAAARRLFGWTEAEAVARPAAAVLGPDAEAALATGASAGAGDVAGGQLSFDGARKDGQPLHLVVSTAQVRDASGQVSGFVLVFKEPAAKARELEQRFQEAQRLEMTGRLTGTLAHDLKNVLSAIKGYAIVAADALGPGDPARGDIDQILKGTERGVSLTQKLLSFSRNPAAPRTVLDLDAHAPAAGAAAGVAAASPPRAEAGRVAKHAGKALAAGEAARPAEAGAAHVAGRTDVGRGATILVVEDDDLVRVLVARVLRRRGYGVIEASTPADADRRAAAHKGQIDLLLTDIGFPDGTGPELARRMAAERPEMRVLLMSGYGRAALIERGLLPGLGVLEKPFSPDALIERIRAVLGDDADS